MKLLVRLLGVAILLQSAAAASAQNERSPAGSVTRSAVSGAPSDTDPLAAIRRYVAEHLSTDEAEIQVRPAGAIPIGFEVLAVKEAAPGVLLGRATFLLTVKRRGGAVGSRWSTADVSWSHPVWVARRSLKRLAVIGPEDLELRTLLLTQTGHPFPEDREAIVGKRIVRGIEAGTPVRLDLLEPAPVIVRGAPVTLVVESVGVRITTTGQAKEDGFAGKSIAVMNLDSRKVVYGEVVDSSTVRIPLQ